MTKKNRLLQLLTRTRTEMDKLAVEIANEGDESGSSDDKEVKESIRARIKALETRVSVIRGDTG